MARLDGDRRLAARGGRIFKIARRLRVLRTIGRNNDVVEAERENHFTRDAILFLVTGFCPIAIGPEALVEIASMQVNQMVALLNDLLRDQERRAVGLRAVHTAWVHSIHALAVYRIKVWSFLLL